MLRPSSWRLRSSVLIWSRRSTDWLAKESHVWRAFGTGMNRTEFKQQLRRFRILTVVGYALLLLILISMIVATEMLKRCTLSVPVALLVAIVGIVLMLAAAYPCFRRLH